MVGNTDLGGAAALNFCLRPLDMLGSPKSGPYAVANLQRVCTGRQQILRQGPNPA
jgi:hypothetical protein